MIRCMARIIIQNRYFLGILLMFYLFAVYRMLLYSKIDNHLYFNQLVGNPYIDVFFKYLTYLGDGWFVVTLAIVWLWKNIRQSIILLVSYVIAGGMVAILKNYVFDVPRPHFVFEYFYKDFVVKYVDGVELLALNSFPSGHSTAALMMCTLLSIYVSHKGYKIFIAIIGILIMFSRVYLSQHWLNDIVVGSFIGCVTSICVYALFEYYEWLKVLDRSIRQNVFKYPDVS